ncbi:LysR family transcriptional regulator [Candidatus Woesearchaeota archaeon]|nr:LysR family transcriptional regulator [Candidatus Woesearchaeota archaeon]|tara:strand:+ start:686 stop:1192 length:507 start_codon:yes stop_codon:yes gene_type:complete
MGKNALDWSLFFGRILISFIFVMALLGKLLDPQSTMTYMLSLDMVAVPFFFVVAVLVEALGVISLILGYKVRTGAWLLILFLIITTLIFHRELTNPSQQIHFFKNLAILGGLLIIAETGPGTYGLDGNKRKTLKTRVISIQHPLAKKSRKTPKKTSNKSSKRSKKRKK